MRGVKTKKCERSHGESKNLTPCTAPDLLEIEKLIHIDQILSFYRHLVFETVCIRMNNESPLKSS